MMANLKNIQDALPAAGFDAVLLLNRNNLLYATGFYAEGAALVTPKQAFLVTDSRYTEEAGKKCDPAVTIVRHSQERSLELVLAELVKDCGVKTLGAEDETTGYSEYMKLQKTLGMTFMPAQGFVHSLRCIKTADEVKSITAAQRIAERALLDVLGLIKPGLTEREIAAELTYRMMLRGGEGNSFSPIVVSGPNSSLPHGVPGDRPVAPGDFITMDFGCLRDGYCSDMTRTVALGFATDEMKRVYETVLAAQLAGIALARPGVTGAEVHNAAAKVIDDAGYGEYFGHGFGHGVGLDIHEEPYENLKNKNPLPEGAVVTAEPGIYLPGQFGVRIEDMLYLSGDGCLNLTEAPKQLLII